MLKFKEVIFITLLLCLPTVIFAQAPTGLWKAKDDKTGANRAVIRLSITDNILNGKIVKVYPKPGDTGICNNCPGKFKNKSIKGLQIVWGLTDHGSGVWEGGEILDPKTGKIYHVKMTFKDNKLYVRGYLGLAVFGRTQIWER